MSDLLAERTLPNGKLLQVVPLTFGRARLYIGPADMPVYDDGW